MDQSVNHDIKSRRIQRLLVLAALIAMVLVSVAIVSSWDDSDGAGDASDGSETFTARSGDVEIKYRIVGPSSVSVFGEEDNPAVDKNVSYVKIPETVTYKGTEYTVSSIDAFAFNSCKVEEVVIPDTVNSIGKSAFGYCFFLSTIEIPDSIVRIEEATFVDCGLRSFTIPDGVIYIGDYAFMGCMFDTISLPSSVEYIGYNSFGTCLYLKSIEFSEGLTSMETYAFSGCISLESVKLPEGLKAIPDGAFSNCGSLSSVTISSTVETIGAMAFLNDTSLKSVFIPPTVDEINASAFMSSGLETVYVTMNTECNHAFDNVLVVYYDENEDVPDDEADGMDTAVPFVVLAAVIAAIAVGFVLGKQD